MVKKLLISVVLLCFSVPAFAFVDTVWVRRYNGPQNDDDAANAVEVDSSGNVYVTGYRTGIGSLFDYATIRYHPDGDSAWTRRYNGPGNGADVATAIGLDASGNVYVTGYSADSTGIADFATLKYDSLGYWRFLRRYDGPGNGSDAAQAMAMDDSGNVYVTGYSQGDGTDYDYATIKYLPNGVAAWVARYNGPGNGQDWANDMAVDASGFVYVTGRSEGIGTGQDFATIKYHSNGDTAWVRRYDGPTSGRDEATAIDVDIFGNIYVTGQSHDTITDDDYLTIKYFPNGDTAWARRYNCPGNGPDEPHAVAVGANGYVYVTGGFATSGG
ncbi:MAG: SBBP repeat-containing protein [Candidatus Zixiibacteriota bacterium]